MTKTTTNQEVPRVLHLVPGFKFGGIESLLMSLYRGLDKTKLQFDFMVDTCDKLPEFEEIEQAGGRIFQMGRYLDSPIKYQLKLNRILRSHAHEYIALHSHTVIRALPVLLAAKRYKIKQRILHSHTDSLEGSRLSAVVPIIARVTGLFATDYLACSENAGCLFFENQKYTVFNNTIRTQQFMFDINDRIRVRQRLGIEESSLVIGHTGRFTYQKNHKRLVKIFAELYETRPDARLILVGSGPLEPEIRDLVFSLGLVDVVFFTGKQDNVAAYLSAMDVFLLTSRFEGFCISILEAQANGLPCVSTDVIPEEVKLTPSIVTRDVDDSNIQYVESILKLSEAGRRDSMTNISLIREAGYDSDLQQSAMLNLYIF